MYGLETAGKSRRQEIIGSIPDRRTAWIVKRYLNYLSALSTVVFTGLFAANLRRWTSIVGSAEKHRLFDRCSPS